MRPADFKIHELIESLMGTCQTIDYFLPDVMTIDDLTTEDYETIDGEIFNCATCGWWCEICEEHDSESEQVCDDCYEGGGDE